MYVIFINKWAIIALNFTVLCIKTGHIEYIILTLVN